MEADDGKGHQVATTRKRGAAAVFEGSGCPAEPDSKRLRSASGPAFAEVQTFHGEAATSVCLSDSSGVQAEN